MLRLRLIPEIAGAGRSLPLAQGGDGIDEGRQECIGGVDRDEQPIDARSLPMSQMVLEASGNVIAEIVELVDTYRQAHRTATSGNRCLR